MKKSIKKGDPIEPTLSTWKENLFITDENILQRYQIERQLNKLVLQGNYAKARSFLDALPTDQEHYLDFMARTDDEVERRRQVSLIMNSGMRILMLSTNIPVTVIHGIATYFGRVINTATDEVILSGNIFDVILKTYCSMVQEFGQETYSIIVKRIVDYMVYHIACDLTLHQIAEEFSYSPAYVNRLLKRETGYSAMQYIRQKRIALAKTMLLTSDTPVAEIAVAVGYKDVNYFSRVFHQVENMSPTECRTARLATGRD